jgi:hypothetical protein
MKKHRRFHTRKEIIEAIENCLAKQKMVSENVDVQKTIADESFAESAKHVDDTAEHKQLIYRGKRARIKQWKGQRALKRFPETLEQLKQTLAAFDTTPVPFVD